VKEIFSSFRPAVVFHLTSDSQGGRALSLIPGSLQNDLTAAVNVLHGAASADTKVERFAQKEFKVVPRTILSLLRNQHDNRRLAACRLRLCR
jgi:hypothetical protein